MNYVRHLQSATQTKIENTSSPLRIGQFNLDKIGSPKEQHNTIMATSEWYPTRLALYAELVSWLFGMLARVRESRWSRPVAVGIDELANDIVHRCPA
jgi:hypothetical protein